jgi:hypothetical protein
MSTKAINDAFEEQLSNKRKREVQSKRERERATKAAFDPPNPFDPNNPTELVPEPPPPNAAQLAAQYARRHQEAMHIKQGGAAARFEYILQRGHNVHTLPPHIATMVIREGHHVRGFGLPTMYPRDLGTVFDRMNNL